MESKNFCCLNSKHFRRNQKGITLVTLAVTIIILLILSGITITAVIGDNGIIKKAQEVTKKVEEAQQNTEQQLGELENQLGQQLIPDKTLVTGISLDKDVVTVIVGECITLNVTVTPSNATNKEVTWSSSNTEVATVDSNGKVTRIKGGTAIITATAKDGSGKSASCEVTVIPSSIEDFTVTLDSTTYKYDGTAKEPTVTVTKDELELENGEDYTVEYSDNTNVGTAKVTVNGIGNYTGTKEATFTITKAENPLKVSNPSTIYVGASINLATNNVTNAIGTVSYAVKSTTETTAGSLSGNTYKAGSLSTSNDNNGTVVITVTAAGNDNYNSASKDITITVQKYTATLSWSSTTPSTITYGTTGKSATATVSSSGGTVGAITYTSGTTSVITINSSTGALIVARGTGSSVITATMARTATVKQASTTKTITTSKTTNPLTVTAKTELTYTGSAQALVTVANAQGTVYYSTSTQLTSSNYKTSGSTTISKGTNAGSYTVYYYTPGNDNYAEKSGSVVAEIASNEISFYVPGRWCTAVRGMTWREWVNSEYYAKNSYITLNGVEVQTSGDALYYSDRTYVRPDDVIIKDYDYKNRSAWRLLVY